MSAVRRRKYRSDNNFDAGASRFIMGKVLTILTDCCEDGLAVVVMLTGLVRKMQKSTFPSCPRIV